MKRTYVCGDAATRFWAHVQKGAPDGCWLWTGAQPKNPRPGAGHGRFNIGNRRYESAHRMAYQLGVGAIPAGLEVCHTCDNPRCVNPLHLFVAPHRDNVRDMMEKGRGRGQFEPQMFCKRGHLLAGDNVIAKSSGRRCRTCENATQQARRRRKRECSDVGQFTGGGRR